MYYDDAPQLNHDLNTMGSGDYILEDREYNIGPSGIVLDNLKNINIIAKAGTVFTIQAVPTGPGLSTFGSTVIKVTNSDNVNIFGLNINGNGFATNLIGYFKTQNSYIEKCVLNSGGGSASLIVIGGNNNIIQCNKVYGTNNVSRGMWIGNTNAVEAEQNVLVENNYILNCNATGLVLVGYMMTAKGNNIQFCQGAGICVSASVIGGTQSREVILSGNTCNNNAFHGIQSDVVDLVNDRTSDVVVVGNQCHRNAHYGLYIPGPMTWTYTGNSFTGNVDGEIYHQ